MVNSIEQTQVSERTLLALT